MSAIRCTAVWYLIPALLLSTAGAAEPEPLAERFEQTIPNTAVTFEMVLVPCGDGGAPLYVATTELTWDVYDVYLYGLDVPLDEEVDAESRPSKPYVPPDRGFGHAGYPAMGMTTHAAEQFCVWLSDTTGKAYRLPTESEWAHFASFGVEGDLAFDVERIDEHAWYKGNTTRKTEAVALLEPTATGLYDIHGNVAEWCTTEDGHIAKGGSYKQQPDELTFASRLEQHRDWNRSDPQIPKSRWWLADCGFVGMRLVCEPPLAEDEPNHAQKEEDADG